MSSWQTNVHDVRDTADDPLLKCKNLGQTRQVFKDRQINLCLEFLSIKNQVSGKSVFVPVKEGGMRMNIILGQYLGDLASGGIW
jgi:hypothetical protein